jgi:N-acetylmuramoyl-L-alanine amidase
MERSLGLQHSFGNVLAGLNIPRRSLFIWLSMILLIATVGCTPSSIDPSSPALADKMSLQDASASLGMRVTSVTAYTATLKDGVNTVVIYSDPNGQAFINGQSVGEIGGYRVVDGTIYIPRGVLPELRARMQKSSITAPPLVIITDQPSPALGPGPLVKLKNIKVVIDAGHGGTDSGTQASGAARPEKNINLAVATIVADTLRQHGVEVIMTRSSDVAVDLDDRCSIANRSGAKAFVSIHADSNRDSSKSGHTIILPASGGGEQSALAQEISSRMASAGSPTRAIRKDDRGLRVLTHIKIPNVIVELGFLSNSREAAKLSDPAFQHRVGEAIADGIIAYITRR